MDNSDLRKLSCKQHALFRLHERYGIDTNTGNVYEDLTQATIDSGEDIYLASVENTTAHALRVSFQGQKVTVLFDEERDCIVTVLPQPQ